MKKLKTNRWLFNSVCESIIISIKNDCVFCEILFDRERYHFKTKEKIYNI